MSTLSLRPDILLEWRLSIKAVFLVGMSRVFGKVLARGRWLRGIPLNGIKFVISHCRLFYFWKVRDAHKQKPPIIKENKIRTMKDEAEKETGPKWSSPDDPRITQ